ncbi:hypothetical protein DPMN_167682 [Dreissena polymorpha]|uniref:Uncharacterized protein n=1 Tax=Dreissena polymorpha TaxID=45954 RepID=A0A9D4IV88_DREPO|nr:hypothetical protein DPMN_167682 [Dreissena polymorpha]
MKDHEHPVSCLLISPDDNYLVTGGGPKDLWSNAKPEGFVYSMKAKKKLHNLEKMKITRWSSVITTKNIMLSCGADYKSTGTIFVCDLCSGEILHEVVANSMYEISDLYLHCSQTYALISISDTGITNGVENKYAGLVDINNGKMVRKWS